MIRIHLEPSTRDELQFVRAQALAAQGSRPHRNARANDAGWSAPRIVAHLGLCGGTIRDFQAIVDRLAHILM